MTDSTTRGIDRDSENWPQFAPSWAEHAIIDGWPGGGVTFERAWTVPSVYRDADPLAVVRVAQEWATGERGTYVPGSPRVMVGRDEVWSDERAAEVAATLREIAEALDPRALAAIDAAPGTGEGAA